jgi:hypothetical protein
MGEPCDLNISIHSLDQQRQDGKTYSLSTSTTFLTPSLPCTCTSTLTSSNTSSCPGVPISGVLSRPGMNLPVPLVSQHCTTCQYESQTVRDFEANDLPHQYIKSYSHPSMTRISQRGVLQRLHLLLLGEMKEGQSSRVYISFGR